MTTEAQRTEQMRLACAEVFTDWIDATTKRLTEAGIDRRRARSLPLAMLSSLEGTLVLAHALRSTEPVAVAGNKATADVRKALIARRETTGR
jgi:hypothetical protein